MKVHGRVQVDGHAGHAFLVAAELVDFVNGFRLPVGPVQEILKDGDGEGMFDMLLVREDDSAVLTVEVTRSDDVKFGVDPEQSVGLVICKHCVPCLIKYFISVVLGKILTTFLRKTLSTTLREHW